MGHYSSDSGKYYTLGDIVHAVSHPSVSSFATVAECDKASSKVSTALMRCKGYEPERKPAEMDECTRADAESNYVQDVTESEADDACDYSDAEVVSAGKEFVDALGVVLMRWVEQAAAMPEKSGKVSNFHSVRAPPISVPDYIKRIRKYFACSDECFVIALVYLDRITKTSPAVTVSELTVHRMTVIAIMIAAKFQDDVYYSNKYYAKVAGLSLKEVNGLEAVMLKMLDWRMAVFPEEYQLYHSLVSQSVQIEVL